MKEKYRIGVIGLGMGCHHVENYKTHPKAEVVALCDLNAELLAVRADKYAIAGRYTNPREMFEKESLDIVSIAVPNKFHKGLTIEALEMGCHVLCEKPMAMNAQEARDMLEVSRRVNKRIMINFSFRFTEQSWALKSQVDSGILGDIYFARSYWHRRRGMPGFGGWFSTKELSGGGPLIDLGVHRLDLALWLMNYPKPKWVMGSTYNPIASKRAKAEGKNFDVEDFAAGMIKFENGATVEIEASWAANIKERENMLTQIMGTEGGLVQRNINEGYEFEAELFIEREGVLFDMQPHSPVPQAQNAMYHYVDSIDKDLPHVATGEEGLIVMEILDALYRSAETGEPIKVG